MIRVLMVVIVLGAIPLAAGRAQPLNASGTSGPAYAWGYNADGELGNGSLTESSTPMPVSLPSGVTAIAAGGSHSLAIDSNGQLYAWGSNSFGELGNASTASSNVPVPVSLPTGVTATTIAAGYQHSLAIGSDGGLYAWGLNVYGQLGNGSFTTSPNPTPALVSLPSGTAPLARGPGSFANHSLAILVPASAVTASQTGASNGQQATASVGGTGPNTPGSYTATAFGSTGTVTVTKYAGNPTPAAPPGGGNYFDVKVSSRNTFTSSLIVDCNLGGANTIYWNNGTTWKIAAPQSPSTSDGECDTLTVDSTSSSTLSQLAGTPFASGTSPSGSRRK